MPKVIPQHVKQEAIRLRVEERLGIRDIQDRTGLAIGTLSVLLRDVPLSDDEISAKMSESALRNNSLRKYRPEPSKFMQTMNVDEFSTERKGRIAEAAVMFRLAVLGYDILRSVFEGSKVDCVAYNKQHEQFIRLQIKWARRAEYGRPIVELRRGERGKKRFIHHDSCDFVVGYDFETDTAYVFPVELCAERSAKTCDNEYAEAWHQLGHLPKASKFLDMIDVDALSTERKGRIAEAAVILRLAMLNYTVFRSVFEGSAVDCFAYHQEVERFIRLQVKWARPAEYGRPVFQASNSEKNRYLNKKRFDFYVAYALESDTAFVIPSMDCDGKRFKACDEEYAEAWHVLGT